MKITLDHYDYMYQTIHTFFRENGHNLSDIKQAYKNKGLSDMRLRWDMAMASGLIPWICKNIYKYANDDHIDTALRKITNTK